MVRIPTMENQAVWLYSCLLEIAIAEHQCSANVTCPPTCRLFRLYLLQEWLLYLLRSEAIADSNLMSFVLGNICFLFNIHTWKVGLDGKAGIG